MKFNLLKTDGGARHGVVVTAHGTFETPAFMPVGTQGSVKAMTPEDLGIVGTEIILSNTYHLYLRPGLQILRAAGGLHPFMNWRKPLLTDSGGYQVFSLAHLRRIEEAGVRFRSHIDGSSHHFTPEAVVEIQRIIGADIMMVLDECLPYPSAEDYARSSNELTVRWAARCQEAYQRTTPQYDHAQSIFAIVQGSIYHGLRESSAQALSSMGFDGYAIGGLAVGEPAETMYDIVSVCTGILPESRPRYLMGVGTPENLLEAIERGVDMFDCVLPTRNGRNAMLFTRAGNLNITNSRYKDDFGPVDADCECYTCRSFTRSYVRHLFLVKEILALRLATLHNLYYYQCLMKEARKAIAAENFRAFKQSQVELLSQDAPVYS